MLVSGREETTEKSLISLQPLREHLGAEIILTDTGCSKEYIDKIRVYVDKVLSFTWCNDFAKARNLGLEESNGQWFMFIDDDEWFEDVTPIIEFFQSGEYEAYHQAVYRMRNYSNFEGTQYTEEWVSRIIRVEEDTHFEGAVHECLMPVRGKCKQIRAFVHHYGYVFATEEAKQAHFNRNASILLKLLEEEPNNMKWPLQLIKEYHSVKDYEKMKELSLKTLERLDGVDEFFLNMCRGSFYLAILIADAGCGDLDGMKQAYGQFLQDEKNPWNVRCAIANFMLLEGSEDDLQEYVNVLVEAYEQHQEENYTEQEEIIADSVVFVKEYVHILESYAMAIENGLAGNGEFLNLPDRVWKLAAMGVLPLEEMLLALPMSQWMAQLQVLTQQGYRENWIKIAENLSSICTQSNIRYTYFDCVTELIKMKTIYSVKSNVEKMDYETMTQIITDFAQANLNYMDYMYTEAAYEGDMELFSPEEKASLWIANGLATDMSQWKTKLQYFSEAAKVCPILGDFIKRYMKLIGEELVK